MGTPRAEPRPVCCSALTHALQVVLVSEKAVPNALPAWKAAMAVDSAFAGTASAGPSDAAGPGLRVELTRAEARNLEVRVKWYL